MRYYAFMALVLGSLPIILRRPFVGLVLYTVLNLIRPELLFWGSDLGNKVLFLIMAATLLSVVINGKVRLELLSRWNLLAMLWIVIALAVSVLLSDWRVGGQWVYTFEIFKVWIACALVMLLIGTPKEIDTYVDVLVYSTAFMAVWGIQQFFGGNRRLEGLGGGTVMEDSNFLAAHFVLILPLAVHRLSTTVGWKRLVAAGASLATVFVVFATLSRGGLLGLIACGVVIIAGSKHRLRMIATSALVFALAAPFVAADFIDRISGVQSVETMDASGKGRLVMWQAAWMIFKDKPLFGCGFLTFPIEKVQYASEFLTGPDGEVKYGWMLEPKVTHSLVFQVLSEGGLFLLAPIVLLYVGTWIANRRRIARYAPFVDDPEIGPDVEPLLSLLKAISAGMIGWLVCALFLDGIVGFYSYVVVTLAAVVRLRLDRLLAPRVANRSTVGRRLGAATRSARATAAGATGS